MKKGILGSNKIAQIGIIVKDIEETAKNYADFFEVKMPKIMITAEYDKTLAEYKGEPTKARSKLAFFKFKNITLELIEPIDEPSSWKNHLDTYGESVHHIAFNVKGTNKKLKILADKGMKLEQKGNYTAGHYAFVDTRDKLKFILELLELDFKKI
ncbi:MAG: VOC family protein [archaeon]|nr:VOC family protein [archaeon]